MNRLTDQQLLRDYSEHRAETAFAELVRRHVDLVYSAALRMVRDAHLAEDVTQNVFVALARNARQLTDRPVLSGWLHRTAQNVAANAVRSDVRRRTREQEAATMNELFSDGPDATWEQMSPHLDATLGELSEADRDALLLRYFERRSAREMAATLGISDEAAQKRVSRALDRLRELFAKRGIPVGASGLVGAISTNAVQEAPVGLALTIPATAVAALSITAPAGAGATTGFFGTLPQLLRMRLAVGLAATAVIGVGTFLLFRSPERAGQVVADSARTTTAGAEQNQQAASTAAQDANAAVEEREPDPLNLLQAVARARQRIVSGSLDIQLSAEHFGSGRRETNHLRLAALFDGPKLRYEQFGREYSYTYSEDEAKAQEISRRADSMDREAAVRAGLLKPFESRHVTAYDGTVLLDYWENDGKPIGTTIDDPSKGTSAFIFDPRCLGLRTSLSVGSTVESCLGYKEAKSINLVGQELVEGIPAWHVSVQSKYHESLDLDFWIEVAHPDRVLKHARGSDVVVSKYGDAGSFDPIPTEVTTMDFRNGSSSFGKRFIRSNSHFNLRVDPSSFTLAGLGMAIGTPVSDIRIRRQIGYWTGTELSEDLPPKKRTEPESSANLSGSLAMLEFSPSSFEALEAATWILLNTPDGPEVQKAAEVILREHTRDTNLVHLCKELERLRHRCSKPLLEALLRDNPSADVRGTACFSLATLLKEESKYGEDKKATMEAEKLFERVIREFGRVRQRGFKLEDLAKPELSELRRLSIGQPAPEIEGEDLEGEPMKLSDYRGKVVVLAFWWPGYSEAPDHRKLVERMAGQPFAFIGVYGNDDLAKGKADVEKYRITWPSFWDKRSGPISTAWNVRSWPNVWVLDRQGVIRYRGVRGRELKDAVDTLLHE